MSHDEIIARVRKLYALAKSTNEHEAAVAMAAAEALIQKHRIAEAELENPGEPMETAREGDPLHQFRRKLAVWRAMLSATLARNYGCVAITDRGANTLRIFGRPSDVALLRLQYARITEQIDRLTIGNTRGLGRSYADSYRKGIVITIAARLRAAKAEAQQAASSQAIVRLDARETDAHAALRVAVPERLRPAPPVRVYSSGFAHGRRDGHHVNLGESLESGETPRRLGEAES